MLHSSAHWKLLFLTLGLIKMSCGSFKCFWPENDATDKIVFCVSFQIWQMLLSKMFSQHIIQYTHISGCLIVNRRRMELNTNSKIYDRHDQPPELLLPRECIIHVGIMMPNFLHVWLHFYAFIHLDYLWPAFFSQDLGTLRWLLCTYYIHVWHVRLVLLVYILSKQIYDLINIARYHVSRQ